MKSLIFCLLILNFHYSQGQSLTWYGGSVVLSSGKVITGEISVEPLHDIILVQDGDKRIVYPAHKVKSVFYYDSTANINRRLISVKESNPVRVHYRFFEVVVNGEVSLLRRQTAKGTRLSDADDFQYSVYYKNELVPLRKFSRTIYPQLRKAVHPRLENFIAVNKLGTNTDVNSIRIIEYYNLLMRSEDAIARY